MPVVFIHRSCQILFCSIELGVPHHVLSQIEDLEDAEFVYYSYENKIDFLLEFICVMTTYNDGFGWFEFLRVAMIIR